MLDLSTEVQFAPFNTTLSSSDPIIIPNLFVGLTDTGIVNDSKAFIYVVLMMGMIMTDVYPQIQIRL